MKINKFLSIIALFSGLFVATAANASVNAYLWENNANATDATVANLPATSTADASFTTTNIAYDSNVNGYTVGSFLDNPVFSNQSANFVANGGGNWTLNNTLFEFVGQTYLQGGNNTFTTIHDDGFELQVPSLGFDVSQPGPTAATPTTYTIVAPTAGYYSFIMAYGECCGPPATVNFQVNGAPVSGVPEPTTLTLMGLGFAGIRLFRRKAA